MSVSLDIVRQVIEVQIVQDQVVQVQIWDGVTIMDDGASAGTTRIIDFIAGSNVTITTEKVGTKIKVTINSTASGSSGTGDVTGPASSTDGDMALFNGATGKIIKILSGSDDDFAQRKSGVWTNRTLTQVRADLRCPAFYINNTALSSTGTVAETLIDSIVVPANTVLAGDVLEFWAIVTKVGTAGTMTVRINANTSASLTGDTTLATNIPAASNTWSGTIRRIHVISQTSQYAFGTGSNVADDATVSTLGTNAIAVDFTVQQFFTLSIQLANAGDAGTLRGWYVNIIRV